MEGYPVTFKYVRPTYPIGEKIFIRFQRLIGSTDLWTPRVGDWVAVVKGDTTSLSGCIFRKGLTQQLVDLFKQTGESCVVIEQDELPLVDIGVEYQFIYVSGVVIKGISSKFCWLSPRSETLMSLNVPMNVTHQKTVEHPTMPVQQHCPTTETQTHFLPKSLSKDQLLKKTEVKPQTVVTPKVEEKIDISKFLESLKLNPTQYIPTIEELIHQNDRLIESLREKQKDLIDLKLQTPTSIKQVGPWMKCEKPVTTKVDEKVTPVVDVKTQLPRTQLPKTQTDLVLQHIWPLLTTIMIDGKLPLNFSLQDFLEKECISSEWMKCEKPVPTKVDVKVTPVVNVKTQLPKTQVDLILQRIWPLLTTMMIDGKLPVNFSLTEFLNKELSEFEPSSQLDNIKILIEELITEHGWLYQQRNKVDSTMKSTNELWSTGVPVTMLQLTSIWKKISDWKPTVQIETLKGLYEELLSQNGWLHQRHNEFFPTMKSASKEPVSEQVRPSWWLEKQLSGLKPTVQIETLKSLIEELVMENELLYQRHNKLQPNMKSTLKWEETEELQCPFMWRQIWDWKPTTQVETLTGLQEELGQTKPLNPTCNSWSKRSVTVTDQVRPTWWWLEEKLTGLQPTLQIETLKRLIEELVMENQLLHQRHNTLHPNMKSVSKTSEKVRTSTTVPTEMFQLQSMYKKISEWKPTAQIETLKSLYGELLSQNEWLHQRHNVLHPTMKSATKVPVSEQVRSTPFMPTLPVELTKNKELTTFFETLSKDFCWDRIEKELREKIEETYKCQLARKTEQPMTKPWEQPMTKSWEQPMTKPWEQPMTKTWEQPMTKPWEQQIHKDTVKCMEKRYVSDEVTFCPVCGINKPIGTTMIDFHHHVNSHFRD